MAIAPMKPAAGWQRSQASGGDASAIVAASPTRQCSVSGARVAAFFGLVPRQSSSGGKERLGRIPKMGDRYIRTLLVVGATAVTALRQEGRSPSKTWAEALLQRKPFKVAAVALANRRPHRLGGAGARGNLPGGKAGAAAIEAPNGGWRGRRCAVEGSAPPARSVQEETGQWRLEGCRR